MSYPLSQMLGDIELGKLALPELQRPFVWKKTAVRDLFDSMYRGFPVGYLMLWHAAEVDGKFIGSDGKQHTPTIANLSYVEWPENIEISATAPASYWPKYRDQFSAEDRFHHALPEGWDQMAYFDFLEERRKLMAAVIRKGFETIGATEPHADVPETPSLVPRGVADAYLHPDPPFSNELAIRRVIRELRGSVL